MAVVLVVDSDGSSRELASRHLREAQYVVVEATDGMQALRKVFELHPDIIVMDLNVPEMDGGELIRVLRAMTDTPIVVLAADHDPDSTVRVLDSGADDYLEKPFSGLELVARVRAAIRRASRDTSPPEESLVIHTGDIVINRDAHTVTKHGALVQLTRTEFRLLEALGSRVGEVAPHRFLLSTVWGDEFVDDTHYLRVYIGYLRNKLEEDPSKPRYLINEWGTGYRLAALPVASEPEEAAGGGDEAASPDEDGAVMAPGEPQEAVAQRQDGGGD